MDQTTLVQEKWPEILQKIKTDHELTSISYQSWLEPLQIKNVDNSSITFIVPSGIMGINVLNKKYTLAIKVAIAEVTGLTLDIHYVTPDAVETPVKDSGSSFTEAMIRRSCFWMTCFQSWIRKGRNSFLRESGIRRRSLPAPEWTN